MTIDLGILVSGSGTNLQAILDAISAGTLDARVRIVISNRADAYALQRAKAAGIQTKIILHREFPTRESFDAALVSALREESADWIVLAGFMRVVTPVFLNAFPGKIINLHPALLPAFPGLHAVKQALDAGVKVTGCSVHFVDEGVDTGRVIAQRSVPVEKGDTEQSLAERIHVVEHVLLVDVLRDVAAGIVRPNRRSA
jgi:phosphoribosylglycinamide formyltransferase-1